MLSEYRRIADKLGVTPELVQELEAFQWRFVRDNLTKGRDNYETFENIYLRYLGTFHASKDMLEYIERNKDKRNAKDT
jgi:hypothetical protein